MFAFSGIQISESMVNEQKFLLSKIFPVNIPSYKSSLSQRKTFSFFLKTVNLFLMHEYLVKELSFLS